ncbi:serine/threonine protein kinase [Burkholderia ubonensis]|uniref:non-specific serine/threonine protein kinase n=1 Tax=Burkholderia ubonensis TaxID=101571 RepID=A0A118HJH6_9BURK|nr:serine/threonine-protein kinase [Burkholderia ubonensis]AOJ65938.1 serine/threonine protein kinase [Burkholderia ubonensis]KVG53091.1 serine/threonine protein kinase [Burkholderia ubonensis]
MKDSIARDNGQDTASRGDAAEVTVRPLPLGHRLGELQLDEVLGIGGFGIVYRAFDRTLRRAVAIKEYMPSMLATRGGDYTVSLRSERFAPAFDAGRGAFLNEARLLAQFDHPGLVKVLHFWESHGTAYMVMPFYEGRTLKQLLDGGVQMSETQLRDVVAALLGALDTLHRAQCFHRDVALDNVLIRPDGNAILLDFGAARKQIGDLVDDGAMMIKPGYAPIEQYTDDPAFSQGPWTDLYALGAVMHAMITGELPPAAVVRSIKDTYRPLATRELAARERYSPGFLAAVDHALQLRIADRPESVAAFAAELGLSGFGRAGYGADVAAASSGDAPASAQASPAADAEPALRRPAAGAGNAAAASSNEAPSAAGPGSSDTPATSTQRQPARDESAVSGQSGAAPASSTPGVQPVADTSSVSAKAASAATAAAPASGPQRTDARRAARAPWHGGRRAGVYVGGALAVLLAIGIGAAYLAKPVRTADSQASGASVPQAATPAPAMAPEPGRDTGLAAAQHGPTPIVIPPSSQPAEPSVQEPTPAVATTVASEPAAPPPPPIAKNTASAAPAASLDASERVVTVPPSNAAAPSTPSAPSAAETITAAPDEPRPPDRPATVAVRFHVRPWGDVYVSGVRRGASPPLRSVSLAPGTYEIEIRNGELPPLRRTVTIDPGSKPISIDYAFE